MSEMTFTELIEQLKAWGVIFDKGLSTQEIRDIESDGKFRFPDDLKEFLSLALPLWEPRYQDYLYILSISQTGGREARCLFA